MNIQYMLVTPDVSQLEMSSLNVCKPENRSPMSVIDETTQPEIGPYVLRAVAWSLTHIWTAVSREALVANGYELAFAALAREARMKMICGGARGNKVLWGDLL